MSKHCANKLQSRLLTINQAAAYWGVCPNTFRKLVREGIAPGPINTPGLARLLFDRVAQDEAINARSGRAKQVA